MLCCIALPLTRADALALLDEAATMFVPTTDHSQRILRKPVASRTQQDTEYLKSFLLQFKPFQELSAAGLEQAVFRMTFERPKPGAPGTRRAIRVLPLHFWCFLCIDAMFELPFLAPFLRD